MENFCTEDISELTVALSKAQRSLKNPEKNRANPHFKSRYADLAAIIDAIKDALSSNGLSFSQIVIEKNGNDYLRTILMYKNQRIISDLPLKYDRPNMQGIGSALTYARRYGLEAIIGIEATEDDDGNACSPSSSVSTASSVIPQTSTSVQESSIPGEYSLTIGFNKGKKISEVSREALISQLNYLTANNRGRSSLDEINIRKFFEENK